MTDEAPSGNPRGRTIAIGDIHGCAAALAELLRQIAPQPHDTLVTLGDYVNRGPDTQGVIEQLLALAERCRLVPLLGNHDERLLTLVKAPDRAWANDRANRATLASYGPELDLGNIPQAHVRFLEGCRLSYQSPTHLFAHANYDPEVPLEACDRSLLVHRRLEPPYPGPHVSRKRVIVGHTAQRDFRVLDLGHVVCIDTGCCYGGWLTALEVDSNRYWQARQPGVAP